MDLNEIVVTVVEGGSVIGAMNRIYSQLPHELRKKFNDIKRDYMVRFGPDGFADRVQDKSVATIFAEYDGPARPAPVTSGERNGLKWELYDPPVGGEPQPK